MQSNQGVRAAADLDLRKAEEVISGTENKGSGGCLSCLLALAGPKKTNTVQPPPPVPNFSIREDNDRLQISLVGILKNCIHRSNMVRSEEIEFEMDEKGERISLGRSEFGNIVVCKYQDKPHTYKEIRPSVVDENNFERFLTELNEIGLLKHECIVQCFGVVLEPKEQGILFEQCIYGSVDEFLKKTHKKGFITWGNPEEYEMYRNKPEIPISEMKTPKNDAERLLMKMEDKGIGLKSTWAIQVAKGIAYMHGDRERKVDEPVIHGNLKGATVLIAEDLSVKISDFCETRYLRGEGGERKRQTMGDPYFTAPEFLGLDEDEIEFTKQADTYSYAMFLLEMFFEGDVVEGFGKKLSRMAVISKVCKGWRPDTTRIREKDDELAEMMEKMWQEEWEQRPLFNTIIKDMKMKVLTAEMSTLHMSDNLSTIRKNSKGKGGNLKIVHKKKEGYDN